MVNAGELDQPHPLQARVAVLTDDDVIVHGDAERLRDIDDGLGHLDVGLTRIQLDGRRERGRGDARVIPGERALRRRPTIVGSAIVEARIAADHRDRGVCRRAQSQRRGADQPENQFTHAQLPPLTAVEDD